MKTIEERASEYTNKEWTPEYHFIAEESYIAGAKEQKAIDIDKVCEWLSNYFVFEHEAMSAAGCDAFLRKLRKELEE